MIMKALLSVPMLEHLPHDKDHLYKIKAKTMYAHSIGAHFQLTLNIMHTIGMKAMPAINFCWFSRKTSQILN